LVSILHLSIQPAKFLAEPRSKGLGNGFLGSEPGGQVGCGSGLFPAIGLLGGRKDLIQEMVPVLVEGITDTVYLDLVDPHAYDVGSRRNGG
jgi:hypothetical protein